MGGRKAKGAITVFLSLISVLFLSLICTTLESARIQGARAQTANITDMGNYSVFGEYEKKLLEDYEIFSVDASYGTGDFSIGRVNDRLRFFMKKNASPKESGLAGLCFDLWNLQMGNSEITEYALLTDRDGEAFYQQAVAYMKSTVITGGIGKLYQYYRDARTAQDKQEEYQQKKSRSDNEMRMLERQEEEKKQELEEQKQQSQQGQENPETAGETEIIVTENPLKAINRLRRKKILDIVCGQNEISEKEVSGKELASNRKKEKGTMKISQKNGGLTSDLLFREYLLDHFPSYLDSETGGKLGYQIEYILCGKKKDRDNLKSVVQKLLLLREGFNYLYCVDNYEMKAQAGSLAALLIGWTGIPVLVTIMEHALLLGWAYGESLMDVKTLLDGGKVPLIKTEETWRVTLERLGQINEMLKEDGGQRKEGMRYEDYLRILLNMQSVSAQKKRALDMMELNIKMAPGLSNFRVDYCVVGMREQTAWMIPPVFSRVSEAFLKQSAPAMTVVVKSGFAYE